MIFHRKTVILVVGSRLNSSIQAAPSVDILPQLVRATRSMSSGNELSNGREGSRSPLPRKKFIFAPGDLPVGDSQQPLLSSPLKAKVTTMSIRDPSDEVCGATPTLTPTPTPTPSSTPATSSPSLAPTIASVAHAARAKQFEKNPPLTISQLNTEDPLQQFHAWFTDPRLHPSMVPETCTLATASLPSGRVSARMVYLKELDDKGWVIYSNWGSREGKGGQVFGTGAGNFFAANIDNASDSQSEGRNRTSTSTPMTIARTERQDHSLQQGNQWAALTFMWKNIERQVRIEGLIEPLSREESELYWRTRVRGSQIGGWASWQSQVLWSNETGLAAVSLSEGKTVNSLGTEGSTEIDDGRSVLEQRVKDVEARFANTKEIPLPPFWGGVRIVPESVEFWQGRQSRLHDRFRYVRKHESGENKDDPASWTWRIERLSP